MARESVQRAREAWALARAQHGVVTRAQLLALGFTADAIDHRLAAGRLHPLWRGVYAVGRPHVERRGLWLAAVLACGRRAVLSHASAAAAWGVAADLAGDIDVSVPTGRRAGREGIRVHRRLLMTHEITHRDGIPVTTPAVTLVDVARHGSARFEAAVNEADKLALIDPEELRVALEAMPRRPGLAAARAALDRRTFKLTDSELERRFRRIARAAGLPSPETQMRVNGFRVDFFWPDLGLVVETDGLRYHRTPAAQARDRKRDQAHAAAGLTPLRFTNAQVT